MIALLFSLFMGIFEDMRYISLNSMIQVTHQKEILTSTYILNNLFNKDFLRFRNFYYFDNR